MPQSLSKILVQVVFSTKNREPFLDSPAVCAEMHRYLGGVCKTLDCPSLTVGGAADHVHLLVNLARTVAIADLVKESKRVSSQWIKTRGVQYAKFEWQRGYGAFSVGQSQIEEVRRYIERQPEHHRRVTFQEEFRRFLEKYRIECDERYVWD